MPISMTQQAIALITLAFQKVCFIFFSFFNIKTEQRIIMASPTKITALNISFFLHNKTADPTVATPTVALPAEKTAPATLPALTAQQTPIPPPAMAHIPAPTVAAFATLLHVISRLAFALAAL